ncbi:protein kinase [Microbacterium sp. QXD-8]|uniref:Protein kinase n=1 Tax=Microbacterium psychrotolerans TaxID=3068321 RepID=A0ABU0Z6T7_9MICO|nr:protein kinase [Microbacterium sp. QXD-8]MDQ7880315.1 protein kinase [Microbacterium sp. QXD-8]
MANVEAESTAALLDGRYRLGECVGEGGMARVYRGEDVVLGRTVAIKVIRPGIDGASSERARSEMAVLASLNHPSLVTLYDARLVPQRPEYLVMEFVEGPTLAARLAQGTLPPEIVGHFAAELGEALHVVHSAGIVHRDIKPSNVLLTPPQLPGARPHAKLADFGIALLLDASRITSPGMVIGTAAYLAPEQVRGADPAPPADVYSLGLVLLEALTGRRDQAGGQGAEVALRRLQNPPTIPDSVDRRWTRLLTRMLDPDPGARPTAAEVATQAGRLAVPSQPEPASSTRATVPVALAAAAEAGADAGATDVYDSTEGEPLTRTRLLPAPEDPAPSSGRTGRRTGLVAVVGASIAAVVIAGAAIIGFSFMGGPDQAPVPAATTPADTVPSEPPAPTEVEDPGDEDVVVDDQSGLSEEEREAAEEAQKRIKEEQKKLDEEQRKRAQEERKKAE